MYEYHIYNVNTLEEKIIFGYYLADAFRRSKLDSSEWTVWLSEYID
jgi:hypothetical protein